MMDLKEKVVIVTGSGRGIGLGIATKFAEAGAKVVISDVAPAMVEQAVQELKGKGYDAFGVPCNVVKADECEELIKKTKDHYGKLDVLVNNAGITRDNLAVRITDEDWDAVLAVNLKGVFNCSKSAVRLMMKQKNGSIINISSISGIIGNVGQANYSASKAGVIALTKTFAKEYGAKNVRVNAIAPGFIKTDMIKDFTEEVQNSWKAAISLKRLGEVEEIANVALFLGSELSSFVTGQVLVVDGGMVF